MKILLNGTLAAMTMLMLFGAFYGVSLANTTQRVEPIQINPVAVEEEDWTLVPAHCLDDNPQTPCGFREFVQFFANLMSLAIVLALALATILFAVAGIKYATSAGNMNQVKEAKGIFFNVGLGLIIVLIAYTVVHVVVATLDVQDTFNIFLQQTQQPR
jgi:hypothetical protein